MRRPLTILFLFFMIPIMAMAQTEEHLITGKVVDKITMKPIPVVRISSSTERVSTNEQGEFRIRAKEGDQLTFVHLTYKLFTLVASSENQRFQVVEMEERVFEMREFEVSDFPSEQAFKEAMMNVTPNNTHERNLMQRNLNTVMKIKDIGYYHDFSSYNTLMKGINTNGGVTFLSTNPSVGLVGALRKLLNGKPRYKPLGEEPVKVLSTRPLWKNPLEMEPLKLE